MHIFDGSFPGASRYSHLKRYLNDKQLCDVVAIPIYSYLIIYIFKLPNVFPSMTLVPLNTNYLMYRVTNQTLQIQEVMSQAPAKAQAKVQRVLSEGQAKGQARSPSKEYPCPVCDIHSQDRHSWPSARLSASPSA